MEDIIGKELLSEVLNDKNIGNVLSDVRVIESKIFGDIKENEIAFYSSKKGWQRINIHELAHRCEDWAIRKGFGLESGYYRDYNYSQLAYVGFCKFNNVRFENPIDKNKSIFDACQWILDNTSKSQTTKTP